MNKIIDDIELMESIFDDDFIIIDFLNLWDLILIDDRGAHFIADNIIGVDEL
jgi:hypothetical protein